MDPQTVAAAAVVAASAAYVLRQAWRTLATPDRCGGCGGCSGAKDDLVQIG